MSAGEFAFALLQPSHALLAAIALGLLVSLRWRWTGTLLAGLGVALLAACGMLPVGEAMIRPLEALHPADPPITAPAGIILLGGYVTGELSPAPGDLALSEAGDRVMAALVLARRFPAAKLIVTDGTLDPAKPSGAEETLGLLAALGVPRERIVAETKALSTHDNAVFAREMVQPRAGETYVLVTSAWHLPRAMRTFAAAGWPGLIAYPVDYVTTSRPLAQAFPGSVANGLRLVDTAAREHLATAAYRLAGRFGPAP